MPTAKKRFQIFNLHKKSTFFDAHKLDKYKFYL